MKTKGSSISVCSNKGHLIQKGLPPSVPRVFRPRGGRLYHERIPRGDLRKPLRGTIVGIQANSSRILLAHFTEGCANLCQSLRQVSKFWQHHQTTVCGTHPYDNPMAVRLVGIRYYGPLPNGSQATEVPSSWH